MKDIMYRNIFRIHCQEFALCLPLWLGWSCMSFSLTLRTGCIEGRTAGRRERAGLSRSWGKNLRSLRFHVAVISKKTSADWCFGTWFLWLSHHIGNFIIPTDELIFFRGVGWNHQPVSYFPTNQTTLTFRSNGKCVWLILILIRPAPRRKFRRPNQRPAQAREIRCVQSQDFGIFWDILGYFAGFGGYFGDVLGEALNKLTLIHLWNRFQHLPYTSPNITHASPKCGEIMITMP